MWELFTRYPTARIEDVGTPYVKEVEDEDVAEYDYIIVGGLSGTGSLLTFQGELPDVYLRID
jgi:hypothetical protein